MKILYRLGYYLAGFSVGLIFLAFILNGKKTSCNYGPSARVKDNILQKQLQLSPSLVALHPMLADSLLRLYINSGTVDFSKSNTKLDSCRSYFIKLKDEKEAFIEIENCEKRATVVKLQLP